MAVNNLMKKIIILDIIWQILSALPVGFLNLNVKLSYFSFDRQPLFENGLPLHTEWVIR